jgi:hypothetical protein
LKNPQKKGQAVTFFCATLFSLLSLFPDFPPQAHHFFSGLLDSFLRLIDALGGSAIGFFRRTVDLVVDVVFQGLHDQLLQNVPGRKNNSAVKKQNSCPDDRRWKTAWNLQIANLV